MQDPRVTIPVESRDAPSPTRIDLVSVFIGRSVMVISCLLVTSTGSQAKSSAGHTSLVLLLLLPLPVVVIDHPTIDHPTIDHPAIDHPAILPSGKSNLSLNLPVSLVPALTPHPRRPSNLMAPLTDMGSCIERQRCRPCQDYRHRRCRRPLWCCPPLLNQDLRLRLHNIHLLLLLLRLLLRLLPCLG